MNEQKIKDWNPSDISRLSKRLQNRYLHVYSISKSTTRFGGIIQGIGALLGIMIVGLCFLAIRVTGAIGVIGLIIGVPVAIINGLFFYLLGTLVSGQGQILKTQTDNAVNTSPLLTVEEKAEIFLNL